MPIFLYTTGFCIGPVVQPPDHLLSGNRFIKILPDELASTISALLQ
jgi:hypothetical protein